MSELTAGANAPVPSETLQVTIHAAPTSVDLSAYRLYANGKVRGDLDMIFYGQTHSDDRTVSLQQQGAKAIFTVELAKLDPAVEKVAFALTCEAGQTIANLQTLSLELGRSPSETLLTAKVDLGQRSEAALILGELYRRNQQWKFRFIAQGFNGGLQPLAEFYGVEIAEEAPPSPAPAPAPAPAPTTAPTTAPSASVNLSKLSLTKDRPTLSLSKRADYGLLKVNLNWHRGGEQKDGFFADLFGNGKVDLDLGAFVRLKQGKPDVIQALGNRFGSLDRPPFVQLLADDRTGQAQDGEWLHINGTKWAQIDEILIFALIYKGAPDWSKTDGVVTLHVPNELPVETRLTDGGRNNRLCAIARLINRDDTFHVERLDRYFSGQEALDQAFGWGFQWQAGRK